MNTTENGTPCTIIYRGHDGQVARRTFHDVTEQEVAAAVAAIVGSRRHTDHRDADWEQLQATLRGQMRWYADRMIEALFDTWWYRWVPTKARLGIVQRLVDYLKDIVDSFTDEMVVLHSEAARARRNTPLARPRSAPENGPRIVCACCSNKIPLAPLLPEGWTEDANGGWRCPQHPVVKEPVT